MPGSSLCTKPLSQLSVGFHRTEGTMCVFKSSLDFTLMGPCLLKCPRLFISASAPVTRSFPIHLRLTFRRVLSLQFLRLRPLFVSFIPPLLCSVLPNPRSFSRSRSILENYTVIIL
ncbi:hypothetical protein L211DRAFT_613956 [Terfezia boudieri ATCC MYA-4762]|uniref:Uncharacterized protein n=1 Tax=Terfezia boudieri ATCC MYA-4762 TaxID=1051890 RepID=A0A3N4M2M1_9PEZI|nr:hypothetical protein L211DRAFT_613956 [Terfezia boudieri ATCC MYA-4762]